MRVSEGPLEVCRDGTKTLYCNPVLAVGTAQLVHLRLMKITLKDLMKASKVRRAFCKFTDAFHSVYFAWESSRPNNYRRANETEKKIHKKLGLKVKYPYCKHTGVG